jgi:hypothetical protein
MKALFALALLFDLSVLSGTFDLGALSGMFDLGAASGTSQVFVAKPISKDGAARVHSLVAANQTFPEPHFDLGPGNHFGL